MKFKIITTTAIKKKLIYLSYINEWFNNFNLGILAKQSNLLCKRLNKKINPTKSYLKNRKVNFRIKGWNYTSVVLLYK
jgi:hypothetical protein